MITDRGHGFGQRVVRMVTIQNAAARSPRSRECME